jgi:His-Xaa-Ser system protein HxsD
MEEEINKEKEFASLKINPKIYSLHVINSAAYSFLDEAYIILDGDPEKEILVSLYPKKSQELKKLGLEFSEQLINYKNYFDNLKENSEITKMIVERALFSANPKLLEEAEEEEINSLIKELELSDDKEIKEIVKEIKDGSDKAE